MVMSDRIALLRSGELEQVASPREIYSRPATAYVAQFIGHTNLLKAEVQGGVAHCGTLSWPAQLPDGQVLFSLRPENIRVSAGSRTDGVVRIDARVLQHAFHGATELVRAQSSDGLVLVVRTAGGAVPQDQLTLEFFPTDAIPVRESPERN